MKKLMILLATLSLMSSVHADVFEQLRKGREAIRKTQGAIQTRIDGAAGAATDAIDSVQETGEQIQNSIADVTDGANDAVDSVQQSAGQLRGSVQQSTQDISAQQQVRPVQNRISEPASEAVATRSASPQPAMQQTVGSAGDPGLQQELERLARRQVDREQEFQEQVKQFTEEVNRSPTGREQYALLMLRLAEVQQEETEEALKLLQRVAEFGQGIDAFVAHQREQDAIAERLHPKKMTLVRAARNGSLR